MGRISPSYAGAPPIFPTFCAVRGPRICRSNDRPNLASDQSQDRKGARPQVPASLLARADEVIE